MDPYGIFDISWIGSLSAAWFYAGGAVVLSICAGALVYAFCEATEEE